MVVEALVCLLHECHSGIVPKVVEAYTYRFLLGELLRALGGKSRPPRDEIHNASVPPFFISSALATNRIWVLQDLGETPASSPVS